MSDDKVIRSAGRLKNSSLCYSTQNPILLPPKSALTQLIVNNYHFSHHHSSVNSVLVMVRETFWIPKGRQVIKSILFQCVICKRINRPTMFRPPPPPPRPRRMAAKRAAGVRKALIEHNQL